MAFSHKKIRVNPVKSASSVCWSQRGSGAETVIPWNGASHTLKFTNGWLKHNGAPIDIWDSSFFVDRKGQVVLVPKRIVSLQEGPPILRGMISDALREE